MKPILKNFSDILEHIFSSLFSKIRFTESLLFLKMKLFLVLRKNFSEIFNKDFCDWIGQIGFVHRSVKDRKVVEWAREKWRYPSQFRSCVKPGPNLLERICCQRIKNLYCLKKTRRIHTHVFRRSIYIYIYTSFSPRTSVFVSILHIWSMYSPPSVFFPFLSIFFSSHSANVFPLFCMNFPCVFSFLVFCFRSSPKSIFRPLSRRLRENGRPRP